MGGPYTVSAQTRRIDRRQLGDDLSAAVADRQLSAAERPHLPDARHLGERPVRGELHAGLVCALQPLRHIHHQLGHRVIGAICGNLFACTLAAYAFARLQFRLKTMWFAIMLMTIMLPFHVVVVPQYIIFNQLGWVNTFVPLILPKFLATDAFFVFLMVQFIRGIPKELDEAA